MPTIQTIARHSLAFVSLRIKKIAKGFKHTHLFNKILSFIFVFFLCVMLCGGAWSIYKHHFEPIKPIALNAHQAIYDTAHILDAGLRAKIADINAQFHTFKENPQIILVSIPSLHGVYISRYAHALFDTLQTFAFKPILIFVAEHENDIVVLESLTSLKPQTILALLERMKKISHNKSLLSGLDNLIQSIFYELLPQSTKKNQLQSFALTPIELESIQERDSLTEILLKLIIIATIIILFVRFDNDDTKATP